MDADDLKKLTRIENQIIALMLQFKGLCGVLSSDPLLSEETKQIIAGYQFKLQTNSLSKIPEQKLIQLENRMNSLLAASKIVFKVLSTESGLTLETKQIIQRQMKTLQTLTPAHTQS